jgi:hypothetical protein
MRGWALALLALGSTLSHPAWAACNGNPTARVDPTNQTVPERTGGAPTVVTLDGSKSTPNDAELQFQWSYLGSSPSGLAVTLGSTTAQKPTFTVPDVPASGAALAFRLKVTCGTRTSEVTTTVNVTDVFVNAPPVASFFISPLDANEGQTVTLDGTGSSDPDGQALSYTWEQTAGPAVSLVNGPNADGSIKTFVAPNLLSTTTFGFKLTVSDGTLSNSQEKSVNVVWTNDPPVAALNCPANGVLVVDEGQSVTFDADGSSDSEGGLTYAWSQNMGLPNLGIGGFLTPSITFTAPQLGYNQLGGMTVTVTVTDAENVSASKSCGLFIGDVTAPVITVPADITAEATSAAGAAVPYAVTSQDAVQDEVPRPLACIPPSNSLFALDLWTTVQCTDQDANGNTANASFRIFVEDTTAPTLTVPGDTAVEADGPGGSVVTFVATSADLVDGEKDATCAPPSGHLFPLGDTIVECSAIDAHDNPATPKSFTVSVLDTKPPVIAAHGDEGPFEATGPGGAAVTYVAPTTQDIVDGAGVATCAPASGSTFALGATTVRCDAQDQAGNDAVPTFFTVTVEDTTPPVIAQPGDIEGVEATSPAGAVVAYVAPEWTDVVSGTGSAACQPASGSTFALGTTTVACTAQDGAGNAANPVTFSIEVVDTTPPVIAAHSDIVGIEATGPGGASVTYVAPLWTDVVSGSGSATCLPASGSAFALGTTTVSCNAQDGAGNQAATETFVVVVVDTTGPSLTPMSDITVSATANSSAVATWTTPVASDLVDGNLPVSCTPPSGTTFFVGGNGEPANTVTCSAQDAAGNPGSVSFDVRVQYAYSGFFRPVDNLPMLNVVKAGQAIPVKFSLGGNQGLSIFAAGYPKVVAMACSGAMQDAVEETVTAGGSSLQYDATTGQYIYVWKSDKGWAGTCRQLQVKFADGTTQAANFSFTR